MTGGAGERLDDLSGYRRRFLVTPGAGWVTAALEDDYHSMAVTLVHDGTTVTAVEPVMERAPWTTCPGAPLTLVETFTGVALADVAARGEKSVNCTHLHDLATLAAAHAGDAGPTRYDILVSDHHDGRNASEIRRNGQLVHRWEMDGGFTMRVPDAVAGQNIMKLRGWIETLAPAEKEAAKLLQWGSIVAHGRTRPIDQQSDASKMPPSCYTFQPEKAAVAKRVGLIIDFSLDEGREPLDHFDGRQFVAP
ncbi:DUF2889 domain-containing protein [Sphingobium sufflavum]|uniref:DUF2889 domain-containing protein n=1 Tax=Sphingobium sufflavum TaxID=1129547 RepID=UPI001F1FA824|nr:DUF2889 domain-containing protein [Sphingobium sufflavum]MCE7796886.1 DUF2889 domain-containing protein [Sphingobium sufflavum]